ncbi:tetratricopeptide repeat protein [Fluviicola chungangensis]|uniref:Tetratricopeptide repeat protein n=1 Tax=Fluviicola chungangensis TaxID=2597671 RepID=A0A556MRI4_9FLAO|nr:tetratricopeptide repeat protein [Fluviicola chungangensis]TSJ42517.1 tetratricopeptide repeat protein [Fluviicola chungangensis]
MFIRFNKAYEYIPYYCDVKNSLLTIALLLFFVPSRGQTSGIDSVYKLGKSEKNIRKKLLLFNESIAYGWYYGDYDKAIRYGKESLKLAHKYKQDSIASLMDNNIGIAYDYKGDYSQALSHFYRALRVAERIKDRDNEAYILSNIGLIYNNEKLYEKALEYHQKSLKIRREINHKKGISASINNLAIVFMDQKQYEKAIHYYNQSVAIDLELKDSIGLADDYNNLGVCYQNKKDFGKSEYYHLKSLEIKQKLKQNLGIATSKLNLGVVALKQGQLAKAGNYLSEAETLAQKLGTKEILKSVYQSLSDLGYEKKDFEMAYDYLVKFREIEKELDNEENIRKQTQEEMNYTFDKERETQRLNQLATALENKKKQEQALIINWAIAIVGMLILGFSFVLYRRWNEVKKQKLIIEEKNRQVEEKNHEILDSINYAKRIQTAILPSNQLRERVLPEHFVLYEPKDIVAGDFYWLEETKDSIIFAVADCTGHGVPGAMMSVICHNALNRSVKEFGLRDPGLILDKTREFIVDELSKEEEDIEISDGMDISLCTWNKDTNEITWAGANNPLWIWKKESQDIMEIKPNKQPIGKHFDMKPFTTHSVELQKGDRIYLITDGYADQFGGPESKKFKAKNLKNLLVQISNEKINQQIEILRSTFFKWKGDLEQIDDVCIMGIEIN